MKREVGGRELHTRFNANGMVSQVGHDSCPFWCGCSWQAMHAFNELSHAEQQTVLTNFDLHKQLNEVQTAHTRIITSTFDQDFDHSGSVFGTVELLEVGEEQAGVGEPLLDDNKVLVDESLEVGVLGGIIIHQGEMLLQTAFDSRIDPLGGVEP